MNKTKESEYENKLQYLSRNVYSKSDMYNDIKKSHHFPHIIKLHTKRIKAHYVKLTKYLLSMPLKTLIKNKHNFVI